MVGAAALWQLAVALRLWLKVRAAQLVWQRVDDRRRLLCGQRPAARPHRQAGGPRLAACGVGCVQRSGSVLRRCCCMRCAGSVQAGPTAAVPLLRHARPCMPAACLGAEQLYVMLCCTSHRLPQVLQYAVASLKGGRPEHYRGCTKDELLGLVRGDERRLYVILHNIDGPGAQLRLWCPPFLAGTGVADGRVAAGVHAALHGQRPGSPACQGGPSIPLPCCAAPAGLRDRAAQQQLSELAALPNCHLAASVDHANAALLWDQQVGGAGGEGLWRQSGIALQVLNAACACAQRAAAAAGRQPSPMPCRCRHRPPACRPAADARPVWLGVAQRHQLCALLPRGGLCRCGAGSLQPVACSFLPTLPALVACGLAGRRCHAAACCCSCAVRGAHRHGLSPPTRRHPLPAGGPQRAVQQAERDGGAGQPEPHRAGGVPPRSRRAAGPVGGAGWVAPCTGRPAAAPNWHALYWNASRLLPGPLVCACCSRRRRRSTAGRLGQAPPPPTPAPAPPPPQAASPSSACSSSAATASWCPTR